MLLIHIMTNCLIGYSGFVGSNLNSQTSFEHLYNSKNIESIKDKEFDLTVCAGVQAVKWWANKNPTEDWQGIEKLIESLDTIKSKKFVLISTVDVYPSPIGVSEHSDVNYLENHPYGLHRYKLERILEDRFEQYAIVRLPGLFGNNLKKNVIYDLLNNNCLDQINPDSSFQYYYLGNLWSDICKVLDNKISLINFVNEPVKTQEIINRFFPGVEVGQNKGPFGQYDLKTEYAELWNNKDYIYSKERVLDDMGLFISEQVKNENCSI